MSEEHSRYPEALSWSESIDPVIDQCSPIRHAGPMSASVSAREIARANVTAAIKEAARHRVAVEGAVKLSVRAVARDVGMVSSAVYRYFPTRGMTSSQRSSSTPMTPWGRLSSGLMLPSHRTTSGSGGGRCASRSGAGPEHIRTSTRSSSARRSRDYQAPQDSHRAGGARPDRPRWGPSSTRGRSVPSTQ